MAQPTARTGPSGLVNPTPPVTTTPFRASSPDELDAAFEQIRAYVAGQRPAPVSSSARFSLETALTLAEKAPELYTMPADVARRFGTIATFLREALTELDQAGQR